MHFFIFVIIICFTIFLFSLFTFSHDDFVLLRRDISTDQVFNYAFGSSLISLIFSRIFYVFLHPQPVFLNPLGFILFPYFPGLSLVGAIFGGILVVLFLWRKKGFPTGRILDFFSLSFLSAMPVGFIGFMLLSKNKSPFIIVQMITYLILFLALFFIVLPRFTKNGKRDGIIGLIFLVFFSVISFVGNIFSSGTRTILSVESLILFLMLTVSLIALFNKIVFKTPLFKK